MEKQNYKNYIFDVDGTLADTAPAILQKLKKALVLNKAVINEERLNKDLIGPPLNEMIKILSPGADEKSIADIIAVFRSYDAVPGTESPLFPGIKSLLKELRRQEKKCFIATNKPLVPTKKLLKDLEVIDFFDAVYCPDCQPQKRLHKAEMISEIIEKFALSPAHTVMVGDTVGDINAAKKAGCCALAVLWGYGKEQELKNNAACVAAPAEIINGETND